jgi:hypothetical protein
MSNVPGSFADRVQNEEVEFRGAISSRLITKLAAIINQALSGSNIIPLGQVESSMLDEAVFFNEKSSTPWLSNGTPTNPAPGGDATAPIWILADGRDVTGSAYASTIGANVPDLRGIFIRCKSYGSGNDDHGDLAIGTLEGDQLRDHTHPAAFVSQSPNAAFLSPLKAQDGTHSTQSPLGNVWSLFTPLNIAFYGDEGGPENRPRNVTVNFYIKIN